MSRARVRRRVVAGGCFAALSVFVAGPAVADNTATPVALADGATIPTPSTTILPTSTPSATRGSTTTSSTPSATPTDTPLSRASAYVITALTDGTHVVGPYGPDLGQSADVALGLASTENHRATLAAVVTYLEQNSAGYVHGDPALGEKADANYAGATGKLALLAQVTGNDPTSFGGIDLVSELHALLVTSGTEAGRFADDSAFGDFANPLGQAFGVLALERATTAGAPQAAVDYLVAAQCADGGFPETFGAKTCTSSPSATGLALQALVAADADCPATRAQAWLTSHQASDGSFEAVATEPTTLAVANVNSTAYAALGLSATRQSTVTALAYLTSMQNADGGLPPVPSSSKTSDVFATAQALVALAQTSFLAVGPLPLAGRTPICVSASATPTASPTSTRPPALAFRSKATGATRRATSSTSATRATSTTTPKPTTASSSATTTSSAKVLASAASVKPAAGPDSAALRAATSDLPRTGADPLTPVAAGLLLVMTGLTLLFASRRRAGRHVGALGFARRARRH